VGGEEGKVEALNALWLGGLRQMSVPGGEERVKGGMVVDSVMVGGRISRDDNVKKRWRVVKE